MKPTDITLKVLQGIREDFRKVEERHFAIEERHLAFPNEIRENFALVHKRFEHSEKLLVGIGEPLAMQSRTRKVALDDRARFLKRVEEHEDRIAAIEEQLHQ